MAKKGVTLTTGTGTDELYPKTRIDMVVDSSNNSIAPQLVLTKTQILEASEKSQARKNIGAVGLRTQNTNGGELDFDGDVVLPKTDTAYITHNNANLQTILGVLSTKLDNTAEVVDNFFADDAGVADVIDTLKDIQDYIQSDESGTADIVARISNIETNAVRHDKAQNLSADAKVIAQKNIGAVSYLYDANTQKYTLMVNNVGISPSIDASTVETAEGDKLDVLIGAITTALNAKQEKLVSGSNIKTVGGTSVLGSGNIAFKTINNTPIVGSGNINISQAANTVFFTNVQDLEE